MPVPDARMEFLIDGVWVDVTDDVRAAGTDITHTRGYREGGTRVDPAAAGFTVASPDGKYSNRNPRSPYFGKLGRNTRTRCTVAGPVYLDLPGNVGDYATTPDTAALDITGDIDVRLDADLNSWAADSTVSLEHLDLIAKLGFNAGEKSWMLATRAGLLYFEWSANGTDTMGISATVPLPRAFGRLAVRATLDVDNGSAGHTVTFYTAQTMAGPWTRLGDPVVTAGTTSIFSGPYSVRLGDATAFAFGRATGRCHAAEIRNGIDGVAVASVDFSEQTPGATSVVDDAGLTWTLNGGTSITDRWDRFNLAVPEWPPSWHVSGHNVTASLTAGGTLRRLGQGQKALDSTLRRRIPSFGPLAYWPMEDQAGSTVAASPIAGVQPMSVQNLNFAANGTLTGSKPLPTVDRSSGACLIQGTVPAPSSALSSWAVVWMYRLDEPNATLYTFMRTQSTGTVREWFLQTRSDMTRIMGLDADGNTVFSQDVATGLDKFGQWIRVDFTATQDGANVDWHVGWQPVSGSATQANGTFAGTVGSPTSVGSPLGGFGSELDTMAIGHVSVWPTSSSSVGPLALFSAAAAWTGETAGERITRLAGEEGLSIAVAGTTDLQQRMGPQEPATLLELLEECEATDGGILYEDRESLALRYRDRASLYNQTPALTIPYGQLAPPLTPVDDDQTIRNDVTHERIGGSSARVVVEDGPLSVLPPEEGGVGIYDESRALSMHDDTQPLQTAAWAAHLGTWDEARYPSVRILLHKYPALIPDVLALDVGDTIRITDLPDFLPPGPIDLMVMGYREDIGPRAWEITLHCAPAGPWAVAVVETARADTIGSELAAAVDADDTTLSVVTTAGPRWVDSATYPASFPFAIVAGGEEMTVTALTPAALDGFDRTEVDSWGAAPVGGTWQLSPLSKSADFDVSAGVGTIGIDALNTTRRAYLPSAFTLTDASAVMAFSSPVLAAGGNIEASIMLRVDPADIGNTYYYGEIELNYQASRSVRTRIMRRQAATDTELAAAIDVPGLTYTAGAIIWTRFEIEGDQLRLRAWADGQPEPVVWHREATDTALTSGRVGVRTILDPGNSNVLPVVMSVHHFEITSPQTVTVTRSVNGVIKSHAAGTGVRLAHPSYVAL